MQSFRSQEIFAEGAQMPLMLQFEEYICIVFASGL
jgi:hypothetical protein